MSRIADWVATQRDVYGTVDELEHGRVVIAKPMAIPSAAAASFPPWIRVVSVLELREVEPGY